MRKITISLLVLLAMTSVYSCNQNKPIKLFKEAVVYKGLYSFGPEVKSFKQCSTGREFWVADSSAQLELKYSQLGFEQPDIPVYVELEGDKIKSAKDGAGADYDSILVVRKLIKITKDLPKNGCN